MKRRILSCTLLLFLYPLNGESDSTSHSIYDRPFVLTFGANAAVGGYFEANSNYFVEEGISEGLSFEARRFNIFLYSAVAENIRFFSELEFEHGTEEIALETAVLDLTFASALSFRMGILLPPLGRFNVEHDSPKYNIIDRPLVSTLIIPATLSEIGLGFFGQRYLNRSNRLGYELYIVNGLGDGIVSNETTGTRIPEGKSAEFLEEDNNGTPSLTGRLKVENRLLGEVGLSFYRGPYNSFQADGMKVDEIRSISISAIDHGVNRGRFHWRSEFATATVDIPDGLKEVAGSVQWGAYTELNFDYFHGTVFNFDSSKLIATLRLEKVDLNVGSFESTGTNIGDELSRVTVGTSFRPGENTVVKIAYQYNWHRDFTDNPIRSAGLQLGVAAYF
ncbi:MAG: hypothetical protein CMG71_03575 [Candidatus Marinimicrobia bacterium]|nr:hypothetical protein [Candidatus Neomarinimicrobiota bacterium]|tara:strand:- start:7778 stop:8950 length:1173 start_codon:yes stop_codon:yes gene_type:complete